MSGKKACAKAIKYIFRNVEYLIAYDSSLLYCHLYLILLIGIKILIIIE